MGDKRIEYEFDCERFMIDAKRATETRTGSHDLRSIQAETGVSASTMSRIGNGKPPDIVSLMRICGRLALVPGNYFKQVIWQKVDG